LTSVLKINRKGKESLKARRLIIMGGEEERDAIKEQAEEKKKELQRGLGRKGSHQRQEGGEIFLFASAVLGRVRGGEGAKAGSPTSREGEGEWGREVPPRLFL